MEQADRGCLCRTPAIAPSGMLTWTAMGLEDFIFLSKEAAQPTGLLIVLFDADKRPVPWAIEGGFEDDQDGIRDLLDLNHDGHAELAFMAWARSSGHRYRVIDLYQANGGYWYRVRGPLAGRAFPLVIEEGKTKDEPSAYLLTTPDYSNVFSDPVPFVRFVPKTVSTCNVLRLPEAEGKPESVDPCHSWVIIGPNLACAAPPIAIIDGPFGRVISSSAALARLTLRAASARMAGNLAEFAGCAPGYIWIQLHDGGGRVINGK